MSFANDMMDIAINESTGGLIHVIKSDDELIQEFKSDVKAAYAAKRYAEKQSGTHKPYMSKAINTAADQVNDRGAYRSELNKKPLATTAKEKKLHDFATNAGTKQTEKHLAKSDEAREKNIKKAEAGKEVKTQREADKAYDRAAKVYKAADTVDKTVAKTKDAAKNTVEKAKGVAQSIAKKAKSTAYKLAKEAVEEWYTENGIVFNEYEAGCVDMFVSELLSE